MNIVQNPEQETSTRGEKSYRLGDNPWESLEFLRGAPVTMLQTPARSQCSRTYRYPVHRDLLDNPLFWEASKEEQRLAVGKCTEVLKSRNEKPRLNDELLRKNWGATHARADVVDELLDGIVEKVYVPGHHTYWSDPDDPTKSYSTRFTMAAEMSKDDFSVVGFGGQHHHTRVCKRHASTERYQHRLILNTPRGHAVKEFEENLRERCVLLTDGLLPEDHWHVAAWAKRHEQEHLWTLDPEGRMYSLWSNAPRRMRNNFRINGDRLVEVDIKAGHFLWVISLLGKGLPQAEKEALWAFYREDGRHGLVGGKRGLLALLMGETGYSERVKENLRRLSLVAPIFTQRLIRFREEWGLLAYQPLTREESRVMGLAYQRMREWELLRWILDHHDGCGAGESMGEQVAGVLAQVVAQETGGLGQVTLGGRVVGEQLEVRAGEACGAFQGGDAVDGFASAELPRTPLLSSELVSTSSFEEGRGRRGEGNNSSRFCANPIKIREILDEDEESPRKHTKLLTDPHDSGELVANPLSDFGKDPPATRRKVPRIPIPLDEEPLPATDPPDPTPPLPTPRSPRRRIREDKYLGSPTTSYEEDLAILQEDDDSDWILPTRPVSTEHHGPLSAKQLETNLFWEDDDEEDDSPLPPLIFPEIEDDDSDELDF